MAVDGFLDIEGGRLHFQVDGAGDPIVFLHGFGLDARMWDGEVERFACDRTVVRCDLRGFGRSTPPVGPFTHAGDLCALLDHLGIRRTDVVGLSMGGGVAIELALTRPELVRSLVLVASAVRGFKWRENGADMTAAWEAAKTGGPAAGRERWLANPLFAPSLKIPEVARRLRTMTTDYSGWHFVNDSPQGALQPPAWERLGSIAARTLVFVGALDLPDFRAIADHLAREIRGARGHVFDGVGHMCNMEVPAAFQDVVAGFLAEG